MIRGGRKTVALRMPVKRQRAVPLQTLASLEQIGTTTPRAEHEPWNSSPSELERWVQSGRADDRGLAWEPVIASDPAQDKESERDRDAKKGHLALVAAIDTICQPRTRTRLAKSRGHRAANANDAPGKLVSIASIAAPQQAATTAEKAPEEAPPLNSIDIEQLSRNFVRLMEQGGKAIAAYLRPREHGRLSSEVSDAIGVVRTLGHIAEYWLAHPHRALEAQANLGKAYVDLCVSATKRMFGDRVEPVAKRDPKDRRFADPEWNSNAYFDFLKQAYLLTSDWANRVVQDTKGVDAHTRQKAEFYLRQLGEALSPANFLLTNPELLRETLSSNAGNLVRGM